MLNSRLISSSDLLTADFPEVADDWAYSRGLLSPGPWAFVATAGQTTYTATGSAEFNIVITKNGDAITIADDFTRSGDIVTFLVPLTEGDVVEVSVPSVVAEIELLASSIVTPTPGGNLQQFMTSRVRELLITDFPWMADPTGVADAGPAFRAARDYLVSIGGGVINMPPRSQFQFSTSETFEYWGTTGMTTRTACLVLPSRISLVGAGRTTTKLFSNIIGVSAGIVAPLDPQFQKIGGFEVQGAGASNNATHGVVTNPSTSFDHVMEDVEFFDLYIHHVGSYGLANCLQSKGVRVHNVKTRMTGADGIDWKQGSSALSSFASEPTDFRKIDINSFGQRAGAGSPSGIGFRGPVRVDGITVRGVPSGLPGIQFVAGIVTPGDIRLSASHSSITNYYVEGADPKGDAIGISIFSCENVRVGVGTIRYGRCETIGRTTTPYGFDDSGMFEGTTVIPAHGRTAFLCGARGSHVRGGRIISDKVYWEVTRGNLTVGQTVLPLPFTTATNNGAPRFLVRTSVVGGVQVRTILTENTDFTWGSNFVTLTTPVATDDRFFAAFPPNLGFRVTAVNCSIMGIQDYFVPQRMSISTQEAVNSGEFHVMWEGHANIGQINNSETMGLMSRDQSVTDLSLRLNAQGAGEIILGTPDNKLSFFTSPGAAKQVITGSTVDQKVNSLIAMVTAYGLATNSTT